MRATSTNPITSSRTKARTPQTSSRSSVQDSISTTTSTTSYFKPTSKTATGWASIGASTTSNYGAKIPLERHGAICCTTPTSDLPSMAGASTTTTSTVPETRTTRTS